MASNYVEIMREMDAAMSSEDPEAFFAFFTDDVKVHVGGKNRLAGHHQGKEKFAALFESFMETAGNYSFDNHAYLADEEHGVMLQTSRFERDGKTMELQEVFVMHFRDGKVSEMWYVPTDGAAFDAWIGG